MGGPASGSELFRLTGSPVFVESATCSHCCQAKQRESSLCHSPVNGFVLKWVGSYRSNPSATSSAVGSTSLARLGGDLPLFPPLTPLELGPEG